jgi:hypothetical protein
MGITLDCLSGVASSSLAGVAIKCYYKYLMEVKPCFQSWTLGYIESWFPHLAIKENYAQRYRITKKNKPALVISDDEVFLNIKKSKSLLRIVDPQQDIILFKTEKFYKHYSKNGFRCLYVPFLDIYDDCIALRKIKNEILINHNNQINYFCLNRNSTDFRSYLVDVLHENDLIKNGYVTWNDSNNSISKSTPGVIYNSDLSHYKNRAIVGFERNNHVINEIPCSSNVANYFYISKNIPGIVNIGAETSLSNFFPTEKSFLFLFTKRLPIIIAESFRIKMLEDQGFDVFRDIINHEYDMIDGKNYQDKIQMAIIKNKELLINGIGDSIDNRLNKNYDYFINEWLPKELSNLKNNIESLL